MRTSGCPSFAGRTRVTTTPLTVHCNAFWQALKRGGWGPKNYKLQQSVGIPFEVPEGKEKETSEIVREPIIIKSEMLPNQNNENRI